jgi:hypothetical protein
MPMFAGCVCALQEPVVTRTWIHIKTKRWRSNQININTVQVWWFESWKIFKECGQDRVGIHLAKVYDSANTICAKAFTTTLQDISFSSSEKKSVTAHTLLCSIKNY